MKNNIVSIDAVISRIEINGYIDCTELGGYMEDYEYDNIIYYLKKYKDLQNRIDKAIKYYETNQQECVIGRNKDDKLIKEYYLPAQCSKKMLDILKGSGE